MLAAQILSIVAFLVSWLWYVTLLIGGVAMILIQVIWCCRIKKAGLIASSVISALAAVSCIGAGVLMIVSWKGDTYCHVFSMNDDFWDDGISDDDFYKYTKDYDYCNEAAWAVVAFITGALWAAAAGCILIFMTSGRYERCEEQCQDRLDKEQEQTIAQQENNLNNIELGSVAVPIPAATPYLAAGDASHAQIGGVHHDNNIVAATSFVVMEDPSVPAEKE
ncbi:MAG: hypothetical protein SGILL_004928 [Bacillariaceae sp.]